MPYRDFSPILGEGGDTLFAISLVQLVSSSLHMALLSLRQGCGSGADQDPVVVVRYGLNSLKNQTFLSIIID